MEPPMNTTRRCLACGRPFHPFLHVPHQRFCSTPACQLERRRRWQRDRLRADADYRENQARAQADWRVRHTDYWRRYRTAHPAYLERNRVQQRTRNAARRSAEPVANMNVLPSVRPLASGFYILRRTFSTGIAKMNACTVHIAVLTAPGRPRAPDCKEMT